MKMKEISYQMSRTINTGNYELAKVDITMVAGVDDGEKPSDVFNRLRDLVKRRVDEEVEEILEVGIRERVQRLGE